MPVPEERYDIRTAAAWILGHARRAGVPALPEAMLRASADSLPDADLARIVDAGLQAGLKLYPF